jgi:hypothetical protein
LSLKVIFLTSRRRRRRRWCCGGGGAGGGRSGDGRSCVCCGFYFTFVTLCVFLISTSIIRDQPIGKLVTKL